MTFSDITALAGLALSAAVFYLLATRARGERLTVFGFTHADGQIDSGRFGASLVAASTSLATVLLFFLSTASYYGIVLLWCGLTYYLGQRTFLKYVKGKPLIRKEIRTLSDLWYDTIRSSLNARIISAITFSAFLMILFVELYVGSVILSSFIRPFALEYSKVISFGLLSLLVIGYVRIGGLRAVMHTDQWQLKMLLAAVFALAVFAFVVATRPMEMQVATSFFDVQAETGEVILFCAWILVLNMSLPFIQLSSWQRLIAAKSEDEAWKGFKSNTSRLLFVWIVPVLVFVYLLTKGIVPGDLDELFEVLRSEGGLAEGVLYPIIVVGFGAALFSTADTALIALGTTLADKNTFQDRLEGMSEERLRRVFTTFGIVALGLLTVVFAIAEADLGAWFMPLIYAIFGQLTVITPLVFYSLARITDEPRDISPISSRLIAVGLLLGWLVIIAAVFVDRILGTFIWSQMATFGSLLISGGFLALGLWLDGRRRRERAGGGEK